MAFTTAVLAADTHEKWVKKKPERGDHIRVQRNGGLYAHHGIYISDIEVIHFTGKDGDNIFFDWPKNRVISSSLSNFLKGGTLEVKVYTEKELKYLLPTEQIVKNARDSLGDKGYNLVFNNCEHFANKCTLGHPVCKQVARVANGKMPIDQNSALDKAANIAVGGIAAVGGIGRAMVASPLILATKMRISIGKFAYKRLKEHLKKGHDDK